MYARRRRTVLALLALFAFIAAREIIFDTDDQRESDARARGAAPVPGASPTPEDRGYPIKHIVFIVKENRTFDNYFARYPGAEGTETGLISTGER
jgi:phospholipase C